MAVHTHLSERTLREHLRRFPIGELIEARGVTTGPLNTLYHLSTTRGRYLLRILENRTETDARFEETLLNHLAGQGLPVPRMVVSGKGGSVVPLSPKQQMTIFQTLPGRVVAVFEVTPRHTRQVGQFLASMHTKARGLGRRRRNRMDPRSLVRLLARCHALTLRPELRRDIEMLQAELTRHTWPRQLPRGVIHSEMTIESLRFSSGQLCGAFNFDVACTGPMLYDLAAAMCDWAFYHDELSPERLAGIISGYESVRPLKAVEREALFDMLRYAAVRFAASHIFDYEIRRRVGGRRHYKDYRHFTARLTSLATVGRAAFAVAAGW